MEQITSSLPPKAITLMLGHQDMANHLEEYPQDQAWAEQLVEQNLFRSLVRCQQLSIEVCARFPYCLCGTEALENSMKDMRNRNWEHILNPLRPEPTPPENSPQGPPPRKTPAKVMPKPRELSFTKAVA